MTTVVKIRAIFIFVEFEGNREPSSSDSLPRRRLSEMLLIGLDDRIDLGERVVGLLSSTDTVRESCGCVEAKEYFKTQGRYNATHDHNDFLL
mmetsp:Transcript_13707/g.26140  ORF Transcript_13707/g.26140 Transcript_13707/m.26140 type:complete len:92 (-) Transcript_13707:3-278(-)